MNPALRRDSFDFRKKCYAIVTFTQCIAFVQGYIMSWDEQRRIEQSREHVAAGGKVYDILEAAFELATTFGWSKEEFMLAAQDVSKKPILRKGVGFVFDTAKPFWYFWQ